MTSVFTQNTDLEEPGLGDYPNSWNVPLNSNLTVIDDVFGSSTSVAFTNTNVTLTVAQSAYFQITCTGTLTGNVELILPGTIGGRRVILNQCTGAFTLTVLNGSSDTGGGIIVGQGFLTPVVMTAGRAYYDAYGSTPPGTLLPFAGVTPPPGFFLTFGSAISRTTYSQLFSAIGTTWGVGDGTTTFNLPDFRGIVLAGADNMGGTPAGRLIGYSVGISGGNQSQSITVAKANLPNTTFPVSGITLSDPGHFHGLIVQGIGMDSGPSPNTGWFGSNSTGGVNTGGASTGVTISSQGNASSGGSGTPISVSDVQPTAAINYMIRY